MSGLIRCKECDYTAVPGSNFKNHNAMKHESRNKNVNNATEKGQLGAYQETQPNITLRSATDFKCIVLSKKYIRKWKTCFPPLNKDINLFCIRHTKQSWG